MLRDEWHNALNEAVTASLVAELHLAAAGGVRGLSGPERSRGDRATEGDDNDARGVRLKVALSGVKSPLALALLAC